MFFYAIKALYIIKPVYFLIFAQFSILSAMKFKVKILFLLASLLFSFSSMAQNFTDAKGLKQGPWEAKYSNGTTRYKGTFKDGKPVGEFKRFFESGELRIDQFFKDDGSSYVKVYYENKVLAAEGKYVGDKKDSIWRYYSYYDKTLRMTESYKTGIKEGLTCRYFNNGKLSDELMYHNNKKNGIWKQYFDNGQVSLKAYHVDDVRTGGFTTYFSNGMTESTGKFDKGLADGPWFYYDESGNEKSKIIYHHGVAENQEQLDKEHQEYLNKLEMNIGRIPEPVESDFTPR